MNQKFWWTSGRFVLRLQVSAKVLAVVIAFLEVLWSLRSFDWLITGSIVSLVKVLFVELWFAEFS